MQAVNNSRAISVQALALQVQDEAYTYAYYLTGDEKAAEAATQAAFSTVSAGKSLRADRFRQDILRGVLDGSRSTAVPAAASAREELTRMLLRLPVVERSALVLVDILGLDYDAAADVMGCSRKVISKLLAQGRLKSMNAGPVQ